MGEPLSRAFCLATTPLISLLSNPQMGYGLVADQAFCLRSTCG